MCGKKSRKRNRSRKYSKIIESAHHPVCLKQIRADFVLFMVYCYCASCQVIIKMIYRLLNIFILTEHRVSMWQDKPVFLIVNLTRLISCGILTVVISNSTIVINVNLPPNSRKQLDNWLAVMWILTNNGRLSNFLLELKVKALQLYFLCLSVSFYSIDSGFTFHPW